MYTNQHTPFPFPFLIATMNKIPFRWLIGRGTYPLEPIPVQSFSAFDVNGRLQDTFLKEKVVPPSPPPPPPTLTSLSLDSPRQSRSISNSSALIIHSCRNPSDRVTERYIGPISSIPRSCAKYSNHRHSFVLACRCYISRHMGDFMECFIICIYI